MQKVMFGAQSGFYLTNCMGIFMLFSQCQMNAELKLRCYLTSVYLMVSFRQAHVSLLPETAAQPVPITWPRNTTADVLVNNPDLEFPQYPYPKPQLPMSHFSTIQLLES